MIGLYLLRNDSSTTGGSGDNATTVLPGNSTQLSNNAAGAPATTHSTTAPPGIMTGQQSSPGSTTMTSNSTAPTTSLNSISDPPVPQFTNILPSLASPVPGYLYSTIDQCCSRHGVPQAALTTATPAVATTITGDTGTTSQEASTLVSTTFVANNQATVVGLLR